MSHPRRCPVPGCRKRGKTHALDAHRRAIHPEISSANYARLLRGEPEPRRAPRLGRRWLWGFTLLLLVATALAYTLLPR